MRFVGTPAGAAPAPAFFMQAFMQDILTDGNFSQGNFQAPNTIFGSSTIVLLSTPSGAGPGAGGVYKVSGGRAVRQLNAVGATAAYSRQLPAAQVAPMVLAAGEGPRLKVRIEAAMRLDALPADNGNECGMFLRGDTAVPSPSGTGVIPTNSMGIVSDGAGGWAFVARKSSGAATINIPLTLPFPTDDAGLRNVFAFEIIPPTADVGAVLRVFAGGSQQFEENWDAGNLPTLADLLALVSTVGPGWCFWFQNVVGGATAANLQYTGVNVTLTPVT